MASVQDYQLRNTAITKQITSLSSQNSQLVSEIASYEKSAKEWRNNKGDCSKKIGAKKTECIKDSEWKEEQAKGYDNKVLAAKDAIAKNNNSINTLQAEFNQNLTLIEQAQRSSELVSKELAKQGTTEQAVFEKAATEAKAQAEAITIEAQAKAQAITTATQTEADAKKKKTMILSIVGAVVGLVLVVFLIKKFKK